MKLKIILIISLYILNYKHLFATAQIADRIIFEGKEYNLLDNPLEEYFHKFPEKKPKDIMATSTALYRGYIATFEIKNDSLLIKDIHAEKWGQFDCDEDECFVSILDEVFPNQKNLLIDWVNGILPLPLGKVRTYIHMGYGSTYSKYILLEIKNGLLSEVRELNYPQLNKFRNQQLKAYQKTDQYQNWVKESLSQCDYCTKESLDKIIKIYIFYHIPKFYDEEKKKRSR